ncbi:hypothetical protein KDAU_26940 [Dictyobacter aurantiacus]|uniref:Uncharacterized protein n=1 Tax=Dictyobacter aurantiacus TaxID=1936993 RepID=A0A401ZES4_9CHLR|nr:hypothetical protein KDAU_26940 [Dictyobacter aurantiacus]
MARFAHPDLNFFLPIGKKGPKVIAFKDNVWYNPRTLYAHRGFHWLIRESCALQKKSYNGI